MFKFLRDHLLPQRSWLAALVLLLVRVTVGYGLADAGVAKFRAMAGECAEDPLPDCEVQGRKACTDAACQSQVPGRCVDERRKACAVSGQEKLKWFGGLHLFGRPNLTLPGGGKLNFTLAASVELLAGALLLLGLLARLAAVPAVVVMAVAMAAAHWDTVNGHLGFTGELAFNYMVLAAVIACFGPGRLAIDAWLSGGSKGAPAKGAKAAKPTKKA